MSSFLVSIYWLLAVVFIIIPMSRPSSFGRDSLTYSEVGEADQPENEFSRDSLGEYLIRDSILHLRESKYEYVECEDADLPFALEDTAKKPSLKEKYKRGETNRETSRETANIGKIFDQVFQIDTNRSKPNFPEESKHEFILNARKGDEKAVVSPFKKNAQQINIQSQKLEIILPTSLSNPSDLSQDLFNHPPPLANLMTFPETYAGPPPTLNINDVQELKNTAPSPRIKLISVQALSQTVSGKSTQMLPIQPIQPIQPIVPIICPQLSTIQLEHAPQISKARFSFKTNKVIKSQKQTAQTSTATSATSTSTASSKGSIEFLNSTDSPGSMKIIEPVNPEDGTIAPFFRKLHCLNSVYPNWDNKSSFSPEKERETQAESNLLLSQFRLCLEVLNKLFALVMDKFASIQHLQRVLKENVFSGSNHDQNLLNQFLHGAWSRSILTELESIKPRGAYTPRKFNDSQFQNAISHYAAKIQELQRSFPSLKFSLGHFLNSYRNCRKMLWTIEMNMWMMSEDLYSFAFNQECFLPNVYLIYRDYLQQELNSKVSLKSKPDTLQQILRVVGENTKKKDLLTHSMIGKMVTGLANAQLK